jgi:hypothetical protein
MCEHHFTQEVVGGPVVCKNCGATPTGQTVVNVETKTSTTQSVLQGCGCLVIGFIIIVVIIAII